MHLGKDRIIGRYTVAQNPATRARLSASMKSTRGCSFPCALVGCAFFGRLKGYGKLASLAWSKTTNKR